MHVIHARCAGIDLGKDTLVAAGRVQDAGGVRRECRTYQTTSGQLLELSSWLVSLDVTHIVMEATGSYWKSVWHVLEGQFELMLVNPAQVKNLPGRKSDVNDATWLADLLAHGLVRELRSSRRNRWSARANPYPQAVGSGDSPPYPEDPEDSRCGELQDHRNDHGPDGGERSCHRKGDCGWGDRP